MNHRSERNLDPRAWLCWSVAASAPALVGRNPWPLLVVLVAVAGARLAWAGAMARTRAWSLFLRLALVFSVLGIAFNVLTVRAGDRVIARLPGGLPLIGGALTVNAAVYGILSGCALVLLVMIGATVGALVDWTAAVRLVPDGLSGVAVAGSIAIAFVPQTAIAFREIREAQIARGHRVRGARDLVPVLVPVLAGGLERAITLAESLESRGFGGSAPAAARERPWTPYAGAVALGAMAVAVYALAVGQLDFALVAAVGAILLAGISLRARPRSGIARTRYRSRPWTRRDSAVVAGAAIALAMTVTALHVDSAALRYEPYPHLTAPAIDLTLLAALLGLLVPVLVAPPTRDGWP